MSQNNPRRWIWVLGCASALALLTIFLIAEFPDAIADRDSQIGLTHGLLLLAFLGGSALVHGRIRAGHALRNIVIWLAIGAVVLTGYSYRFEFAALGDRLMGELLPHHARQSGKAVTVRAGRDGHFVVEAQVDGSDVLFLVDTGASDVVLSPADAQRLGFDINSLAFTRTYRTANGTVYGAPVRLRTVSIGGLTLNDVRASVNGADMKRSLLGMSFLGRLSGFEVGRDTLTLKP